jgi:hypothetical protein
VRPDWESCSRYASVLADGRLQVQELVRSRFLTGWRLASFLDRPYGVVIWVSDGQPPGGACAGLQAQLVEWRVGKRRGCVRGRASSQASFVRLVVKQFFFTCLAHAILTVQFASRHVLQERECNTLWERVLQHESRNIFRRWKIARAEHICAAIHIRSSRLLSSRLGGGDGWGTSWCVWEWEEIVVAGAREVGDPWRAEPPCWPLVCVAGGVPACARQCGGDFQPYDPRLLVLI